jgi:hypothetical protein
MKPTRWIARWSGLLLVLAVAGATAVGAELSSAAGPAAAGTATEPNAQAATDRPLDLASQQRQLAAKYQHLEQVLLRLSEVTAAQNPRRAALLREAISQSKRGEIPVHFATIAKLLQEDRLALASKDQGQLALQLDALLQLLLKENRASRLESDKRRVRRYLKELNRLIRAQRGVKARTEGGDQTKPLEEDQRALAEKTGDLAQGIAKDEGPQGEPSAGKASPSGDRSEGKPGAQKGQQGDRPAEAKKPPGTPRDNGKPAGDQSGSKPESKSPPSRSPNGDGKGQPSSPPSRQGQGQPGQGQPGESQSTEPEQQKPNSIRSANERIRAAQQQMERARAKLQEAKRRGANQDQAAALEQLQQAKAMLERILRQMREEEVKQMLVRLEARFRRMLQLQLEIHEGTKRVDSVPADARDHDDEIEAGRLSRAEALLVDEADKALLLLREDGSSVAFPEAVEQIRDDMVEVTDRLRQVKVGLLTQEIEQEIIAALEETIVALRKMQKKMESGKGQSGKPSPGGQMAEPPLVDALAELRMIRSLQLRVNRQTERYRKLLDQAQANPIEVDAAIQRLAERQQRIHQATRDLKLGAGR